MRAVQVYITNQATGDLKPLSLVVSEFVSVTVWSKAEFHHYLNELLML